MLNRPITTAVLRLTAWYVGIIMFLSISFSLVLYQMYRMELATDFRRANSYINQLPGFYGNPVFRDDQLLANLGQIGRNLVLLNLGMLIAGGAISYFLARRNLEPVREALEAQARFTADASHELRTPLTAMRTEIEVALRSTSLTKADTQEVLKSNLEEVIKLKNLSEGLLKLARTDAKELRVTNVSIEAIVKDVLRRLASTAEVKRLTIENKVSAMIVRGDETSLAELLVIIIDNAIKYSHADSIVTVRSERQGRQIHIQVIDRGRGIKARDLPHIFERFYRADASRSKEAADGYGLGLPIAKKIIEANHGSIEVKSTYDKGTTFTIKLPAAG